MFVPPVIKLSQVLAVYAVMALILALVGIGIAQAVGEEPQASVELVTPHVADLFEPIPVAHYSGEYVTIRSLPTYESVPESQVNRGDTQTIFVAVEGQYLIEVGGLFGIAEIGTVPREQGNTVTIDRADDVKPKLEVWFYTGDACTYCDQWKARELPKLAGMPDVRVYTIEQKDHSKEKVPTFVIRGSGKVVERQGYSATGNWNTAESMLDLAE